MAHSGQGTRACVECTSSVICADVVSTSQAARRSVVASGNKRARTSGVWVATKVSSSSKRRCLWGNADGVAHRHQVCHKQVYGCIRYELVASFAKRPKLLSWLKKTDAGGVTWQAANKTMAQ